MRYMGHTGLFQKRRFQGFISEIMRMVSVLRESSFSQLPWDNQISTILKHFVYTHVVLLINIPEQFELYFTLNIQEVLKFYNLQL